MPSEVPVDELLYGKYSVIERLGSGANAEVYKVKHFGTGNFHALKVSTAADAQECERMYQEGQIMAQLRHPNIVRVSEVIQDGRDVALVMDFIDGPTLREILGEPHPVEEALALFGQLLAGVAHAHEAGVLHRDIRPENVLLSEEGDRIVAKLIDFGLAKPTTGEAAPITMVGTAMGTPGYAAPEQAKDAASVRRSADVFSLGTLLYELITGAPAFHKGKDISASLQAVLSGRYTPVERVVPDLPGHISAAIGRALEPDPGARFQTCQDFAFALYRAPLVAEPPAVPLSIRRRGDGKDAATKRDAQARALRTSHRLEDKEIYGLQPEQSLVPLKDWGTKIAIGFIVLGLAFLAWKAFG